MLNRFVYWFWFGLGLSILPIAISCWILCAQHPELSFEQNLINSITKGELLIVCSAILGVNIGDLFREETIERDKALKFSLVGASVIMALFTGGVYIGIATSSKPLSSSLIAYTSLCMLGVTLIICVCSICLVKTRS